jgi:RNA polymerase sigma factor (sigma-70 family)
VARREGADVQDVRLRRWRPALMAFFQRRVHDRTEAEDLTQEVLVRMLGDAQPQGRPDGYVFQIAQNLLVDRARRLLVRNRYREDLGHDPDRDLDLLDPQRLSEGREQVAALNAALAGLPDRTRTIFILYRVEAMGQEAIGDAFGISASAVKQHVAKAMAAIAERLRDVR